MRIAGTATVHRLLLVVALICIWAGYQDAVHPKAGPAREETNNPEKFHLWNSRTSFSYCLTDDPRATDVWMFRTAGGTMLRLQSPIGTLLIQAIPSTGR